MTDRTRALTSVMKERLDAGSCPSGDGHCVHWWDCEPCCRCGYEGGGDDTCDCEKHATQRRIRELEEEVRTWTARLWTLCGAIFEKHPGRIRDLAKRNADDLRASYRQVAERRRVGETDG